MTGIAHRESPRGPPAAAFDDDALWQAFAAASTADAFCRAWLALLCRQLPDVSAGVVLLESGDANTFVPVAAWPEPVRDLSHLGKVAQRALGEGRGIVERADAQGGAVHVAYPVIVSERVLGAVAIEAPGLAQEDVGRMLR